MDARVLLATFCLMPEGEPGGSLLVDALAERGVEAAWAVWDDPTVDWAAADLVAVRATWDYQRRLGAWRDWVGRVQKETRLLNGGAVFDWNTDKAYLETLGEHVPVVPSELVADDDLVGGLRRALARWDSVVVKPRVGAGGVGVVVVDSLEDDRLVGLTPGPWLAQPLVESVRTRGETSVVVLDGQARTQVDKVPGAGEVRVHTEHGGRSTLVDVAPEAERLALEAVRAAETLLEQRLDYARVDMMELDGRLVVSELELIEPGLYLDLAPGAAGPFADLVLDRLG